LVWNDEATGLLLESLYCKTPCGNVILWEPLRPGDEGVYIDESERRTFKRLVVDGQQRICTLHKVWESILEHACQDTAQDGRVWCLDLTVESGVRGLARAPRRRSLFALAKDPTKENGGRGSPANRYNLVPLARLRSDDPSVICRHFVRTNGVGHGNVEEDVQAVRERARKMWEHPLLTITTLRESEGHDAKRIVSLYNRINSAGLRVETEEKAYAALVRMHPQTTYRLREFLRRIHPEKDTVSRSDMLRREKEKSFGFKLWLRTLVQVCNYYFAKPQGTRDLSFEFINNSPEIDEWFSDVTNRANADILFDRARDSLSFVHNVLTGPLCCDDLRMLPDADCLVPALQLLIKYPGLAAKRHEDLIAYAILRWAIDPNRSPKDTLRIVRDINGASDAESSLRMLLGSHFAALSAQKRDALGARLQEASSLADRYVLLLYWLVRRGGAEDFSYENLASDDEKRRNLYSEAKKRGFDGMAAICARMAPEKQHIVPAASLSKAYGESKRITTSQHDINNVGNLTYISQMLNHFVTGLGEEWFDPEKEREGQNLEKHFLARGGCGHDEDALIGQYKLLLNSRDKQGYLLSEAREPFRQFCAQRRTLIQRAFEDWLGELEKRYASVVERIGPLEQAPRRQAPSRTAARHPSLTEDELVRLADDAGVVDLYRRARVELGLVFGASRRTGQNISFIGTNPDGSRTAMVGIWPKASSPQRGLALVVRPRFISQYLGVRESDLKELLGNPAPHTGTGYGDETYILDADQLARFTGFLADAKRRNAEKKSNR
jgi:hypothetical protein